MSADATAGSLPSDRKPRIATSVAVSLAGRWRLAPILVALAIIWAVFASLSSVFLTALNLTNLVNQIAVTAAVALGLVFVLLVRQIDLSLAALAAFAGAIAASLVVEKHWALGPALVVTIAAGAAVGSMQGAIVVAFDAPAFIVTLGGYFIIGAGLLWLLPATQVIPLAGTSLEGVAGSFLPDWLSYALIALVVAGMAGVRWSDYASRRRAGLDVALWRMVLVPVGVTALVSVCAVAFVFDAASGVPTMGVIVLGLTVIASYVAGQTAYGRWLYAIGGSPEAARRAGVRVRIVTLSTFAIAGGLASMAGVMSASQQLGVSSSSSDLTLLLDALAAAVIGGVSVFGGRGSVWAALIGSLVIGSIENGLYLINASTQVRWTIFGVVLIGAVVIDAAIRRYARVGTDSDNG